MNMHITHLRNVGLCISITILWLEFAIAKSTIKEVNGFVKVRSRAVRSGSFSQEVHVNKNGIDKTVEVKELKTPSVRSLPSPLDNKDVTMLSSSDGSILCLNMCDMSLQGEEHCNIRCKETNDKVSTYFTQNRALEAELDEDAFTYINDMVTDTIFNPRSTADTTTRKRRKAPTIIRPNFGNGEGVVKIRYTADASVMKKFQYLVDGNLTETKLELACFIYMTTTQVNLYISTLADWNLDYTTKDNVSYPLNLFIYVEGIVYPPVEAGMFVDPPAIKNNLIGDSLVYNKRYLENGTYQGVDGALLDLVVYLKVVYNASDDFNLVLALTCYDIASYTYVFDSTSGEYVLVGMNHGVIGVALLGQLCQNYEDIYIDARFSVNEIYSTFYAIILAHEIGHNLGASHDKSDECPSNAFTIMAPYVLPRLRANTEFGKFSVCSARDIIDHLSSFTSTEIAACLYTESPTKDNILEQFCKGLVGFGYSLNHTCQFFFGNDSFACTDGSDYVPEDKCITEINNNGAIVPIFYCSQDRSCINSANAIYHPFPGTKCLKKNGKEGKSVCFDGECKTKFQLCEKEESKIKEQRSDKSKSSSKEQGTDKGKSSSKGKGKHTNGKRAIRNLFKTI